MTPVCVDPARVHAIWPTAAPLIKLAMERGGISGFAPVEHAVLTGMALLWLTDSAAAVTELHVTEWRKACVIIACGGAGDWRVLIRRIEEFARAEGCAVVRIMGRKGWTRVLPEYRQSAIVIEKEM